MAFFFLFYVMQLKCLANARALLYLYVIIYSIYNTYKKGQDDTVERYSGYNTAERYET